MVEEWKACGHRTPAVSDEFAPIRASDGNWQATGAMKGVILPKTQPTTFLFHIPSHVSLLACLREGRVPGAFAVLPRVELPHGRTAKRPRAFRVGTGISLSRKPLSAKSRRMRESEGVVCMMRVRPGRVHSKDLSEYGNARQWKWRCSSFENERGGTAG